MHSTDQNQDQERDSGESGLHSAAIGLADCTVLEMDVHWNDIFGEIPNSIK